MRCRSLAAERILSVCARFTLRCTGCTLCCAGCTLRCAGYPCPTLGTPSSCAKDTLLLDHRYFCAMCTLPTAQCARWALCSAHTAQCTTTQCAYYSPKERLSGVGPIFGLAFQGVIVHNLTHPTNHQVYFDGWWFGGGSVVEVFRYVENTST